MGCLSGSMSSWCFGTSVDHISSNGRRDHMSNTHQPGNQPGAFITQSSNYILMTGQSSINLSMHIVSIKPISYSRSLLVAAHPRVGPGSCLYGIFRCSPLYDCHLRLIWQFG